MFINNDFRLAKARQAELLEAVNGDPLLQKARADRPRPLKQTLALALIGALLTALLITQAVAAAASAGV